MGNKLYDLINGVEVIQQQIKKNDFEQKKLEKEKELKKREIDKLYGAKIMEKKTDSNENFKKYLEISNILDKYSSFDVNIIGPVLADLMTKIEGKKYIFYNLEYNGIFNRNVVDYKKKAVFISKESERKELEAACVIKPEALFSDYKQYCLLDSYNDYGENIVTVYKCYNKSNLVGDLCLKIELEFPYLDFQKSYVKDFIDYIIDIKIKNDIKDISKEELELFLAEFLKNYEVCDNPLPKKKKKVKNIDK